jgi:hypothetical protein
MSNTTQTTKVEGFVASGSQASSKYKPQTAAERQAALNRADTAKISWTCYNPGCAIGNRNNTVPLREQRVEREIRFKPEDTFDDVLFGEMVHCRCHNPKCRQLLRPYISSWNSEDYARKDSPVAPKVNAPYTEEEIDASEADISHSTYAKENRKRNK